MAKWTNDLVMNAALDLIAEADKQMACSQQPATYYEAVDPAAWQGSQAYAQGAPVRPVTRNGFVYEATTAGTAGGAEPTWPTTPGQTVADGSVVWTCRANYALTAAAAMLPADFTQANGDVDGRKHAVAQKADVAIHTSGTADHVALVDDAQRRLLDVTTCTPQALTAGGTVTFPTWDHEIGDPV